MEEQGGGPQEKAFVRAAAGWFPPKTQGRAGAGQAPPTTSLPRGNVTTLEISGQVHRVPGLVSGELEALQATPRTARSHVDHTSQQVSHPRRGRAPTEDLGTWGPSGGPDTVRRQLQQARVGGTLTHGRVNPRGLRPAPHLGG